MDATIQQGLAAWGEELPIALRLCAFEAAVTAEDVYQLLEGLRTEPTWYRRLGDYCNSKFELYYSDQRPFYGDVIRAVSPADEAEENVRCAALVARMLSWPKHRLVRLIREVPEEVLLEIAREAREARAVFLQNQNRQPFDRDLFGYFANRREDEDRCFTSPALAFFLRIFVPCYLYFGRSPQQLFSEATNTASPNLSALESLVKLDKRVFHHPRVQEVVHCKNPLVRASRLNRISMALRGQPRRLSRKQVKEQLAGLMCMLADQLGVRLSATRIRKLFDLLARAGKAGTLRDSDLPLGSDAFRQRTKEAKKRWQVTL